jgi:hypothetical protein
VTSQEREIRRHVEAVFPTGEAEANYLAERASFENKRPKERTGEDWQRLTTAAYGCKLALQRAIYNLISIEDEFVGALLSNRELAAELGSMRGAMETKLTELQLFESSVMHAHALSDQTRSNADAAAVL